MRTLSQRRLARLEDAALARMVRAVAREYALTEEETAEVLHETRQELRRWWAGLPLEWDGATGGDHDRSDGDATL